MIQIRGQTVKEVDITFYDSFTNLPVMCSISSSRH